MTNTKDKMAKELRAELRARNLIFNGNRAQLHKRLVDHVKRNELIAATGTFDSVNDPRGIKERNHIHATYKSNLDVLCSKKLAIIRDFRARLEREEAGLEAGKKKLANDKSEELRKASERVRRSHVAKREYGDRFGGGQNTSAHQQIGLAGDIFGDHVLDDTESGYYQEVRVDQSRFFACLTVPIRMLLVVLMMESPTKEVIE